MSTPGGTVPEFILVTSPACHLCEDAHRRLQVLADERRLLLRVVDVESAEGLALVATHRPAMNPLVVADGQFFSSGRLPRGKMRDRLARPVQGAAAAPQGVEAGRP